MSIPGSMIFVLPERGRQSVGIKIGSSHSIKESRYLTSGRNWTLVGKASGFRCQVRGYRQKDRNPVPESKSRGQEHPSINFMSVVENMELTLL